MRRLLHSVVTRLIAVSILVAICSIAATAWLAAQSTSTSIRQELGASLAADAATYQSLISYAVNHTEWNGVSPQPEGRRLILTTVDRTLISDSGGGIDVGELPESPSAVIDPLELDLTQTAHAPADRIDARVAGPFQLDEEQRRELDAAAELYTQQCRDQDAQLTGRTAGGRPVVVFDRAMPRLVDREEADEDCKQAELRLGTLTPTESAALERLDVLVDECLTRRGLPPGTLRMDQEWRPVSDSPDCLASARRTQLQPYVAPPALLFVTDSAGETTRATTVSFDGDRVVLAAGLVLAVTVGVSVVVALRMTRPLRTLTRAAERLRRGEDARVDVRSRGEIGQLSRAFNDMVVHRARVDAQRKAMTNDVSHELRNPLSTLRSWLEGASDGVVELDRATSSALLDETLVLQHLVDDLQDLAAAEAGELRLHPEPVDLRELFDQVVVAHPRVVADGTGVVVADPVRLRQIVTNLVTNALRHTPADGTVRLVAAGKRITVGDTGIGISAEDLPHVFDRFWRADPSRTRDTGGSGLGLAIVHALVQAHGGTITVASEVGHGTTFTLEFP
ncbi:sensor histidine kinase [Umezawaea sp. NPDC059074]|uniref:sensor histidine kinase n=1 Tax=Umezawaea sp. NPDC059074 TaxID=3346716 RepID=UPI00369E89B8